MIRRIMKSNTAIPVKLPAIGERVHMVGVCGAGMTPLAIAMKSAGWRVTGEDKLWPGEVERWLLAALIDRVASGSIPEGTALVIVSSAVGAGHAVWDEARGLGVPVVRRGEALAALVADRPLIAVAGSHGKTTTTAMLATALGQAGIAHDYLLGALFADGETPPARWNGEGPVIAEIDESDGTIEGFSPEILVCVNIDWDHCDQYESGAAIEAAFGGLAKRTRRTIFFCADCRASSEVFANHTAAERLSFGRGGDYRLVKAITMEASRQNLQLAGRFDDHQATVQAGGDFNAINATAALATAAHVGAKSVEGLLASFPGVMRRQAEIPSREGVTVIEDYAHHPAEIQALMDLMESRRSTRIVAIFQPHRFSRTAQFKKEFAQTLSRADRVFLLDVYSAGEAEVPGGSSAEILKEFKDIDGAPPAELLNDLAAAPERISTETRDGDLLVFVGAGDIDGVARATASRLREIPYLEGNERESILRALENRLSSETLVRSREPLGPKTTIRVGGEAEFYAEPASAADLQSLVVAARVAGIPIHVLGRGSNLIIPDDGVRGLVIRLQHEHWRRFVCIGPGRYWAGSGLRLKELCGVACRMGESGFEFLEGIPGTVGGALRMNAGAMGGWIFDLVEQVHYLTLDGRLHIQQGNAMHVAYRNCAELEDAIALGAVLRAAAVEESDQIRDRIVTYQKRRHESQPREPSAGCIFKNPQGDSAGHLIDELGLKGTRVGDAEVSKVHGNFIVNRGHATGADVIELVRRVRAVVREKREIDLEPEVLLYGREWKEVL